MNKYSAISIHPLASSVQRERILLSYQGQYYEANQSIVELVKELQFHETEEEAIAAYTKKKAGKYTPEQVRMIIDKFITPLLTPKQQKRSFLYEKELFSAAAIDKFSDTFRFLFNRWYMLAVFLVAAALDAWFFLRTPDLLLFNNKVNVYLVVGLFAFMLGSSFFHELGHASACRHRLRAVPQLPRTLYRCDRSLEAGPDATVCGEPGRGVFPELLAYNPAGGLSDDGKRHRPLPDSGDEPRFRDDPESLLQVRRLLAGIRPAGGAQPAAAFAGTAGLRMEEAVEKTGRQTSLPAADPSAGAVRTARLFGDGQSFYGILLRICHSDLPVPVCTDLPRRGERTDSLPVEPDDAAVCLAA